MSLSTTSERVIVIDTGSGSIKAGWAGEDTPRLILPTIYLDTASQSLPASALFHSSSSSPSSTDLHAASHPLTHQASAHHVHDDVSASGSLSASTSRDYLVGAHALEALQAARNRASLSVAHPVERGVILDWAAMERIWEHVLVEGLHVDSLEDYSVMMTVSPSCSPCAGLAGAKPSSLAAATPASALGATDLANQTAASSMFTTSSTTSSASSTSTTSSPSAALDEIPKLLFRKFKVASLCMFNSAALSLFSTGRTTGVVLESGAGVTHAVPVFEGFALQHATKRLDVAGMDVTAELTRILRQRDLRIDDGNFGVVKDIKEELCYVAPSSQHHAPAQEDAMYELPDGQVIAIDRQCRQGAPEVLFNSAPGAGDEMVGVHTITHDAIAACDKLLQPELFANVVLAGGTTTLNGFGARLKSELDAATRALHHVNVVQDSQRRHAAWIGGSMFASLPTFDQVRITNQEFSEDPETIVRKKFFG